MKLLRSFLFFLFKPSYWSAIKPVCEGLDEALFILMEKHKFKRIDRYCVEIGGLRLWIANHPQSSFDDGTGSIPSRWCRYQAHKKMVLDLAEEKRAKCIKELSDE